jgi:hypothetical protein
LVDINHRVIHINQRLICFFNLALS